MQSVVVVILGMAGMGFGWFIYSRFITTRIFQLDAQFVTPAHQFNDGVDFVPTNRYVLWGRFCRKQFVRMLKKKQLCGQAGMSKTPAELFYALAG